MFNLNQLDDILPDVVCWCTARNSRVARPAQQMDGLLLCDKGPKVPSIQQCLVACLCPVRDTSSNCDLEVDILISDDRRYKIVLQLI